ncbi:hypothetical protein M8J77_008162 [Diaphorina citri]|nr:hypothetical protein M8J77_008162 [Diaphorina citri]
MMNNNVSACDDFREYSCGNWLKNNHVPLQHKHSWNMRTQISYEQKQKIRDLIVTRPWSPTLADAANVQWKLKTFFDSCMDVESIESDGHKPLTKVFTDVGGWTIQSGKLATNMYSWDPKRSLVKVHAEHGGTPYLKVDVVPDPSDALQNIIRVSPAGLGLPDRNFYFIEDQYNSPILLAYQTYISDMSQLLGVTSVGAKQLCDDIFHYEIRLAEITPEADVLKDINSGYKKVTLREVKQSAPSVNLMDILTAKFPNARLNESTQILVPACNYVDKVSNLISTTDREPLSKYIMWTLASQYFPYISSSFRQTQDVFRKVLHGEVLPLPRWEFCVDTLQRYMGLGVTALVQKNNPPSAQVTESVDKVFNAVRSTIVNNYKQAGWLSPELRNFILQKIQSISLQVGLPNPLSLDKYVNEYYSSLYVYKNDFFGAVESGNLFRQLELQRRLVTPTDETRWLDAIVSPDLAISYIVSANTIVVPSGILSVPFYHPEYTLSLIYGRLGVDLSQAVLSSVSPWNVLYSTDGALLDSEFPAVNDSQRVVAESAPCIGRSIERAVQSSSALGNVTTYETMTRISAVRQAFKALESLLESTPHIHQPALETVEPPSLFFLAYSQGVCSVTSREHNQLLSILGQLSDSALLKTILSQSKQFSDVYSCSSEAELYTESACPDVI